MRPTKRRWRASRRVPRCAVKNRVHRQVNWSPLVGEIVEIRLGDRLIRTGRVDGVTSDDQILWIAADGVEPRSMFERVHDYSAWIEYRWESASSWQSLPG